MNKHITLFAAGLIALGGLTGCNKKTAEKEQGPLELTCIEFSQADSLMNFQLTALLPTGDDEAATAMRDTLMTYTGLDLAPRYYFKGALEGKTYRKDEVWYSYPSG
ncbi:MAG: hypothetical protein UHL07_00695, partial [Bacteroidaceae bacterium]|nr:hypothetical protein [Bacteroidaceae bacterium]